MTEIRTATPDDDADIARIYNDGIMERTATFETELRDPKHFANRLADPVAPPLLVAEEGGRVVGWAGLSPYSERECYSGIGEASMYLNRGGVSGRARATPRSGCDWREPAETLVLFLKTYSGPFIGLNT